MANLYCMDYPRSTTEGLRTFAECGFSGQPEIATKRYFDNPYMGFDLVLDFHSRENGGDFVTPGGILFDSVLKPEKESNFQGASTLGTLGMRGVVKTQH